MTVLQIPCSECGALFVDGRAGEHRDSCSKKGHVPSSEQKERKNDDGKLAFSLFPNSALRAITRVLMFGAKKYSPNNWSKVENARQRYYDAALRHLTAWWDGKKKDAETGESHLAHAGCCVVFLLALEEEEKL